MASYKPNAPFTTALRLYTPTVIGPGTGVWYKDYAGAGERFFASFKTYGGTERNVNGVFAIEDTAVVECWYRPDITSDCRIGVEGTDRVYDVIGEPENIDMRNQYMRFTVRRVKGGA